MLIGMDNRLYLKLKKQLPETTEDDIMPDGFSYNCLRSVNLQLYRFIRVSIKEPESLLFISVAANKSQLPINIQKNLSKRDDIPKGIYEDFKVPYFIGAQYE